MRKSSYKHGFTLVELLVATAVTAVLLAAVGTLAFAMGSAKKSFDDANKKQSQVRYTTMKIQEILRCSKLICSSSNEDMAIWLSDENNDGLINIGELAYIEFGDENDHLRLCTFDSSNDTQIELSSIDEVSNNWWTEYCTQYEDVMLLPDCENVDIRFDESPPYTRFVNISFEMNENGISHEYQINAALRGNPETYLDETGSIAIYDN